MAIDDRLLVCVYGLEPAALYRYFADQFPERALSLQIDHSDRINRAVKTRAGPGHRADATYLQTRKAIAGLLKVDPASLELKQATAGTELIKRAFMAGPGASRAAVRKHWLAFANPEAFDRFLLEARIFKEIGALANQYGFDLSRAF